MAPPVFPLGFCDWLDLEPLCWSGGKLSQGKKFVTLKVKREDEWLTGSKGCFGPLKKGIPSFFFTDNANDQLQGHTSYHECCKGDISGSDSQRMSKSDVIIERSECDYVVTRDPSGKSHTHTHTHTHKNSVFWEATEMLDSSNNSNHLM